MTTLSDMNARFNAAAAARKSPSDAIVIKLTRNEWDAFRLTGLGRCLTVDAKGLPTQTYRGATIKVGASRKAKSSA